MMDWLKILTLILEFIRTILKERDPSPARIRTVFRSKRFRDWLRNVKAIDPDTL